jgi:nitroreductase
MDAIECLLTRRSVRKYLDIPVDWDKIGQILEAGRAAPCAGNLQNWKFIVVLDMEKRKKIAEASFHQFWMIKAPCHIVILAEPEASKRNYGMRGERLYAIQNCAAVAENMLLAAHAQGLGGCWVGAFDEEAVRAVLGIIAEARPQIIITIGYPDEKPIAPPKLKLENVVYLERWWARIKDVDEYMGNTSAKVMRTMNRGKEIIDKIDNKLRGKQ